MSPQAKGELGIVEVHNDVITSIVEHETVRVDGVVGFAEGPVEGLAKRLSVAGGARRGSKVRVDDSGRIFIDLHIVVRYGTVIPEVGRRVQEAIMDALRTMTQASVAEINVHVDGIDMTEEDEPQADASQTTKG